MTQKFQVGDRVQVIAESRLLTKKILEIDKDGEMYRIGTSSDNRWIHIYDLAPAQELFEVPQWFDDAYKEVISTYGDSESAKTQMIYYISRAGNGFAFYLDHSDTRVSYVDGATGYVTSNTMKLINAVQHGYTVEKEPLYRVPLTDEGRDGLLIALSYDEETDDSYEVVHVLSQVFSEENFYKLTEKQIRAYDERYWAFAVPVEEGEG
ncbi:DUF1642 domain-containing protein [Listeria sp. SHR_NRA_18]|uniref:DUF1642 domain-containing protein n=1 Tax=Listeria sp. SHR_NRA_18 TaxID=2269046 RepID=UPI000F60124F|nr:DUF1642 domain-containing protein [Listeria sp. SHR_NRA_18]RQW65344.1 DUF1642 domain-containing protein [Listeria sp. SHR_NRA_18]